MKRRTLFVFPVLGLFLFSCASTAPEQIRKPPAFRVADITLSKAIQDRPPTAAPRNPATVFSSNDPEVFAFLELKNLWGVHTVKWDWIDPQGHVYYSTGNYPIQSAEGKYLKEVTAWHKLTIRGDKAGRLPGDWTLNIYVDKDLVGVRKFRIEPEGNGRPAMPPPGK